MFERWIKFTRLAHGKQQPTESWINAANIAEITTTEGATLIREIGSPAGKPNYSIAALEKPSHFMMGVPILPGMEQSGKGVLAEPDLPPTEQATTKDQPDAKTTEKAAHGHAAADHKGAPGGAAVADNKGGNQKAK